jgi:alpha-methylacyl-CoA racemase
MRGDRVTGGPLAGISVVELAGLGPGPFGAMLLADLGADVIRIDNPRDVPPELPAQPSTEVLARGRRSIALDLRDEADREVARALVDRADALIDPFRPGVAERLGLAPDECLARNPRLVFARMTGWGQDGPLALAAGHDLNYAALAGALAPMGREDEPPPVPLNLVADFGGGGMLLGFGIAAALYEREQSGIGQVIDVAMVDGVATLLASITQLMAGGEWSSERGANWLDGGAPWYRSYRTADDRYLTVGPLEGKFYVLLLERLGLDPAPWPQFDKARWPLLSAELEGIFAARSLADWRELLEGTDVCFAPVLAVDEAAVHPHIAARGSYVDYGGVLQPAPSPRFSRTPGALGAPPPWPGEHSAEIRAELAAAHSATRSE